MMRNLFSIFVLIILVMPCGSLGQDGLNILLINDDGIEAQGLHSLKEHLEDAGHSVTVVAPEVNVSRGNLNSLPSGEQVKTFATGYRFEPVVVIEVDACISGGSLIRCVNKMFYIQSKGAVMPA